MSTEAKVFVYVFCGSCGKEVDSSCYPDSSTLCPQCRTSSSNIKIEELSYKELVAEMDEVDDARKQLRRQLRGKEWSEEDKDLLRRMNSWAQCVVDELRTR